MYQHLKLSPPMGRLLGSPPDTISLGGQPYLTNQTDRETRGRLSSWRSEYGRRVGRILASFAKGVIAHSVWYFCFQHYCTCEKPACWSQVQPAKRSPSSADFCWAQKSAVGGISLSQEILVPSARIKKLCVLQC